MTVHERFTAASNWLFDNIEASAGIENTGHLVRFESVLNYDCETNKTNVHETTYSCSKYN